MKVVTRGRGREGKRVDPHKRRKPGKHAMASGSEWEIQQGEGSDAQYGDAVKASEGRESCSSYSNYEPAALRHHHISSPLDLACTALQCLLPLSCISQCLSHRAFLAG